MERRHAYSQMFCKFALMYSRISLLYAEVQYKPCGLSVGESPEFLEIRIIPLTTSASFFCSIYLLFY